MKPILFLSFMIHTLTSYPQVEGRLPVRFTRNDSAYKVDIYIADKFFTSYLYTPSLEKPVLYPIIASNGSVVTRGFPLLPRAGERIDHPHHLGLWFNYGEVNGFDFWNNSYAIPVSEKKKYGRINHKKIVEISTADNCCKLVVEMQWVDFSGNIILNEETTFRFYGNENIRYVERATRLMANAEKVAFGDSKEGLIGMRVNRAFESPSTEPLVFTDAEGKPTKIPLMDNKGVNGLYRCSSGFEGDSVWGTRNNWVSLTAKLNNDIISLAFFDHPHNPGYPAHAHARGYGLFALNNLGQKAFRSSEANSNFSLQPNEAFNFKYLFVVKSGNELTTPEADKISKDFASGK